MCVSLTFSFYEVFVIAVDGNVITNNDLSFVTYEYCLKVLQKSFHILRVLETCADMFIGQLDVFGTSFA